MLKKLTTIILILVLISSAAYGEEQYEQRELTYNYGGVKQTVNTLIQNESIYIPLRIISEAMGYEVTWIDKHIEIKKSDKETVILELTDENVTTYDGTTYVTSKYVTDILNIKLTYDLDTSEIHFERYYKLAEITQKDQLNIYDFTKEAYTHRQNMKLYPGLITNTIKIITMENPGGVTETDFMDLYYNTHDALNGALVKSPNTRYTTELDDEQIKIITIFQFLTNTEEEEAELDKFVDKILSELDKYDNDVDKLKYINTSVVKHLKYDHEAVNDAIHDRYHHANTAYGAAVVGKSICAGYTNLFTYIVSKTDIPIIKVTGETKSGSGHIWNSVYIEKDGIEDWYYIDTTWNDNKTDTTKYFLTTKEQDIEYKVWNEEVEQITRDLKYPEINEKRYIDLIKVSNRLNTPITYFFT